MVHSFSIMQSRLAIIILTHVSAAFPSSNLLNCFNMADRAKIRKLDAELQDAKDEMVCIPCLCAGGACPLVLSFSYTPLHLLHLDTRINDRRAVLQDDSASMQAELKTKISKCRHLLALSQKRVAGADFVCHA